MGIKQTEEAADRAAIDFYHYGIEKGKTEERSDWTSKGHGPHCLSPIAILSDQSIQTDLELPTTATCDISTQTLEPPTLTVLPQMMTSPPFDWADEAVPLPTQNLTSPLLPRDFSGLCSSNLLDISGHRYLT